MTKILLVEDDIEFAELVKEFLFDRGIETIVCHDPYYAWSDNLSKYALVLLDLGLPGMDGMELCKKFRQNSSIPIIISSARNSTQDKVIGLQLGADDYIPKPYDPDELYARIISLLRRANWDLGKKQTNFNINNETKEISYKDIQLNLSGAELEIMTVLVKNIGHLVSREQLLGSAESIIAKDGKTLEVTISKLRNKLKQISDKQHFVSIRGIGYKLVD